MDWLHVLAVAVWGVVSAGVAVAGNLEGRFATITLDGSLSDWKGADTMYGPSEIGIGAPLNSTFTNVYVANDATNLYIALALPAAASISNEWTYNVFVDADMKSSSGFNGGWMSAGYDCLVQYGAVGTTYSVYSFAGAAQGDWTWNWVGLIGYSYSDRVVEWAIPLSSLGNTTNKLKMEFNVSGTAVTGETWAYQWESGVGTYTIASAPPSTPPTISSVEAAPNQAMVTFSKPVTAASASAVGNYSLSGGLGVLSATPNPVNARKVTLATSQQTQGVVYTLTVNGVTDEGGSAIAANSQATFISSIIVDGRFEDWSALPVLYSNPSGDPAATNFKDVYAYNDQKYLYFRLTLWEPSDLLSAQNNLFIDTDNNPVTGNAFWGGSELLIQGGVGYQQKNGTFNEGLINGLDFLVFNSGNTNWEFRVALAATYASDSLPVFTTNVVNFAFDGELNWSTVNRMPAGLGSTIAYTFAAPAPGPLNIDLAGGQVKLTWPGTATLQACDSLTSGGWTNVEGAVSGYARPVSGSALYFRLMR